jgi:hypothetical protein
VATGLLIVATESSPRSCILQERANILQFLKHIILKSADSKESVATKVVNFGWTVLI